MSKVEIYCHHVANHPDTDDFTDDELEKLIKHVEYLSSDEHRQLWLDYCALSLWKRLRTSAPTHGFIDLDPGPAISWPFGVLRNVPAKPAVILPWDVKLLRWWQSLWREQ